MLLLPTRFLYPVSAVQLQERQGLRIACIEEISYRNEWIRREQLLALGREMSKSSYGQYLRQLAGEGSA